MTDELTLNKLKDYQTNHLFLLIGENPLPNYVAAKLLLSQGGTPYLMHTNGTEKAASRLKKILYADEQANYSKAELVPLENHDSDAFHIQKKIEEFLPKDGTVGLNYTGGTKAMAVHAYRTISAAKPEAVFSYLDPRRLEMCIDRTDGDRERLKIVPSDLPVDLATIFQLHGWKLQSPPLDKPIFPEAAYAFAKFHQTSKLGEEWRSWCNKVLRKQAKDPKNSSRWLKESKLRNLPTLELKVVVKPTECEKPNEKVRLDDQILKALECFGVIGDSLSIQDIVGRVDGNIQLETVCQWLDGEWLENYVLQQVQAIPAKDSIHGSATSFWVADPLEPGETKFQFDVAFVRGYQLFAISCTTIADRSGCKQKLFEAYIRAQQLGGSEARVALVCCAEPKDVNALRTQISNVLKPDPDNATTQDSKIIVFGKADLLNLSAKIGQWIKDNERETQA